MTSHTLLKLAVAGFALAFLSGCLMRQTVTNGGQVVKDGYVVKRPIKEAVQKSR